ncbi:hypothetical protein ACODT5_18775 [Streptomyces sp. 5.8]|uniref:hypothetical protein n=1 Tax=Streptomyces sp. 5.8 TaxID=3406571 RepID=UPI003BB6EEE4
MDDFLDERATEKMRMVRREATQVRLTLFSAEVGKAMSEITGAMYWANRYQIAIRDDPDGELRASVDPRGAKLVAR